MFGPQARAERCCASSFNDEVHVEVARVPEHASSDASEIVAIRVERNAVEIGTSRRRPLIVYHDDLAVDEDLVQLRLVRSVNRTPQSEQSGARVRQQARFLEP